MSSTASVALAGRVTRTLTARLRLHCTGWSTSQHHREASVGAERCSTPRVLVAEVRPCDATTSTTSLVEDGAADRGQACSTCLPLFHGLSPPYLVNELQRVSSGLDSRRRVRSAAADTVVVPPTRLSLSPSLSLSRFQRRRSPGVEQSAINCHCTPLGNALISVHP